MMRYVVSVIDFKDDGTDLVVEGTYLNICEAIQSMRKVFSELCENAQHNNYKKLTFLSKYDDDYLIKEVDIRYDGGKRLFQINLSETLN